MLLPRGGVLFCSVLLEKTCFSEIRTLQLSLSLSLSLDLPVCARGSNASFFHGRRSDRLFLCASCTLLGFSQLKAPFERTNERTNQGVVVTSPSFRARETTTTTPPFVAAEEVFIETFNHGARTCEARRRRSLLFLIGVTAAFFACVNGAQGAGAQPGVVVVVDDVVVMKKNIGVSGVVVVVVVVAGGSTEGDRGEGEGGDGGGGGGIDLGEDGDEEGGGGDRVVDQDQESFACELIIRRVRTLWIERRRLYTTVARGCCGVSVS